MTNGIISKEDTVRLQLMLALMTMLRDQITELQFRIDPERPYLSIQKITRELISEKQDLIDSLRRDYDLILESYGIRRIRKVA